MSIEVVTWDNKLTELLLMPPISLSQWVTWAQSSDFLNGKYVKSNGHLETRFLIQFLEDHRQHKLSFRSRAESIREIP